MSVVYFPLAYSHLREVGATSATRGGGREASAQEGGTGRRLFLSREFSEFPAGREFFQAVSPGAH